MTVDPSAHEPSAHGDTTSDPGASYLPGEGVAVVTPHSAVLVPRGEHDVQQLFAALSRAVDTRAVLAAAAGGRILDLDALPDLALVHRTPTGVRVLLSGRSRCTVVDGGSVTELDGSEAALLGEWGFPGSVTVELAVPGAPEGQPRWPVSSGVVPADRVRWSAAGGGTTSDVPGTRLGEDSSSSPSTPHFAPPTPHFAPPTPHSAPPTPAPAVEQASAVEETPASEETPVGEQAPERAGSDATLVPDWGDEPPAISTRDAPEPAEGPDPAPSGAAGDELVADPLEPAAAESAPSVPAPTRRDEHAPGTSARRNAFAADSDDGELADVDYTAGGGINYARVFAPVATGSTPAPLSEAHAVPARSAEPTGEVTPPATVGPGSDPDAGPGATPPPPPATPDLAGDTVSPARAGALMGESPGTGPDSGTGAAPATDPAAGGGPETAARLCPQNHPNPPHLSACRICRAPLDGPTVRITRPTLGVVRLSTGLFFDLDRPLLFGREPRLDGVDADSAPRLIVLSSPGRNISRSHLRVDIDGWSVHAVDLGGINGTYLRRGAAEEVRLMPNEPRMLMAGDVLVVDDVSIRFEDLP